MSKHILSSAILAVLFSLAGGCAQLDGEEVDESTEIEWPTAQTERIWVDGNTVSVGDHGAEGVNGVCACTTDECFEAWVVDSFGCDVCVSFVCDGVTVAHACSACDASPIHPSDSWSGDGRLDN